MLYIFEYPERAIQHINRLWIKTIILDALTLLDLYLVLTFTIEHETAQIARLFLPFLIFFGVILTLGAVKETIKVRLVPVLEQQEPGVSPYENCDLALSFMKDRKRGKAIARSYKSLVGLASNHSLLPLTDFGRMRMVDERLGKKILYYNPLPAISAIKGLLQCLEESKQFIRNKDAVINELQAVLEVLQEASDNNMKFCFVTM
jgi:hypothetical protein